LTDDVEIPAGRVLCRKETAGPSVERKVLRALARRVLELSRDPTLA
jgi:hypothetical protein